MIDLKRFPDWPRRLETAIDDARFRAFCWGRHDCALNAADCVAAITGHDFGAAFRGSYDSAFGAARALKREGYAGLWDFFDRNLPRGSGRPGRGDLVGIHDETGAEAMAVVGLDGGAYIAGPDGLTLWPLDQIERVWRV